MRRSGTCGYGGCNSAGLDFSAKVFHMKYLLWALQILLALFFVMAGIPKLTQPIETLAVQLPWAPDLPEALVRFIGAAELLGGLGLILPAVSRVMPWLTPLAGAGLALVMVLASAFHLTRGETPNAVVTLVVALIAAFVAYGRWRLAPIRARSQATLAAA